MVRLCIISAKYIAESTESPFVAEFDQYYK